MRKMYYVVTGTPEGMWSGDDGMARRQYCIHLAHEIQVSKLAQRRANLMENQTHPAGWNHPVDQYFRSLVIKPYVLEVDVTPCMMETSCFTFKIYMNKLRLNFALTIRIKLHRVWFFFFLPYTFNITHIPQKPAPSFPTLLEHGLLKQRLVCNKIFHSISGRYVL